MLVSTLLHTRPRSWPIVAAHVAAGYATAHGLPAAGSLGVWSAPLLGAAVLWAIALNGGTLALNGAIDRDTEDVGYLDRPPRVPPGLAVTAIALMAAGLVVSLLLARRGVVGRTFPALYAACIGLSVLYSVPPARLKARAGFDLAVNCLGYGGATFLAGWAATGDRVSATVGWASAGFTILFGALYPLTQIYQSEEDTRRGSRTLTLALGVERSVRLALFAVLVGFVCLGAAAGASRTVPGWRTVILLAPLAAWLVLLVPLLRGRRLPDKSHMYAGLRAWALTDVAVILAVAPS